MTAPKRGKPNKASPGQLVTFILIEPGAFHHASIEDAEIERAFLEHRTGKKLKLMKCIGCSKDDLLDGTVQVSKAGKVWQP